jgi:hypothetical protein
MKRDSKVSLDFFLIRARTQPVRTRVGAISGRTADRVCACEHAEGAGTDVFEHLEL